MALAKRETGRSPLFSSGLSGSLLRASAGLMVFGLACEKPPKEPGPEPLSPPPANEQEEADSAPTEAVELANEPTVVATSATEPRFSAPEFGKGASVEFQNVFTRLDDWVKTKGGTIHAALVDLESDEWLLRARADVPVNPASNAKVLTAAAALELLGPAYQFQTELLGHIDRNGHCERLVLKGGGAPDLTTADLWRLIRVARGQGLTSVGTVVVDQSRFTDRFVPPAFEQQPNEWAPFRAPISALSLNENAITLNVVPTATGQPARIWYDPPGVVVEKGGVGTAARGTSDQVSWTLSAHQGSARLESTVGGQLGEDLGRRRYARRLDDPRLAGGDALFALLSETGVEIKNSVKLGRVQNEPRIAVWHSAPVAEVVRALGKDSNNFVAEMLLVALSQVGVPKDRESQPWSSEMGAERVTTWLKERKVNVEGLVFKNGSGLFDANRISASQLSEVLALMEENPRVYQDFVSHLAMGATDGTMKGRLRDSPLGQRIRAKTGTLNQVDALTGYVQRPGGKSPAAFSVIVVGAKVSHAEIRKQVDAVLLKWAEML